jgi:hypothetical protein
MVARPGGSAACQPVARDEAGAGRLDNPGDFVRIEIESALAQDKRVIPVLVGETRMPRTDELPEGMKPLATRNAAGGGWPDRSSGVLPLSDWWTRFSL